MILLEDLEKEDRYKLVRGCESFFITYKSPKWQSQIVTQLKDEFGKEYEIPIRVILTSSAKAKRYNLTGSQFPLDMNKYTAASKITKKNISCKRTKELLTLMEEAGYLTILKGYYRNKEDCMTTCLRFHDKLLNRLDKKHCDKWGMARSEGFNPIEVVDSSKSTKTKKVFHSLKKFKGVKLVRDEVELVNKCIEKHTITYQGSLCSVVYKRRFEDNLLSAGRWYVVGTFQTEDSDYRNTIEIDGEQTTEIDVQHIHPSILASLSGFKLPDNFDPYDIYSYVEVGDNISKKELRTFMKPCFMALIYSKSRHTALHEIRTALWKNKNIASWLDEETILSSLEKHNYLLKAYFYTKDNWKLCQYLDSSIATMIMTGFAKLGYACLNYHDSGW